MDIEVMHIDRMRINDMHIDLMRIRARIADGGAPC